jgi:type II secretory pathway pseudopilin PulG
VEILIVVVLLGVLAAIVIPAIGNSATSARETTLSMDLSLLRRFIPVYTSQHGEVPRISGGDLSATPTRDAFEAQARCQATAREDGGEGIARLSIGQLPFEYPGQFPQQTRHCRGACG